MNILSSLTAPKLRTVLFSMSIYWCLMFIQFFFGQLTIFKINPQELLSYIMIFSFIWALLFFGLFFKIKGFKIINGIISAGISLLCIQRIYNFWIISVFLNEFSNLIVLIILALLILTTSIYTCYATLFNENFKLVYDNKNDISPKVKKILKLLIVIFICLMISITIMDLGL